MSRRPYEFIGLLYAYIGIAPNPKGGDISICIYIYVWRSPNPKGEDKKHKAPSPKGRDRYTYMYIRLAPNPKGGDVYNDCLPYKYEVKYSKTTVGRDDFAYGLRRRSQK